jgi:hypothetical protein
MQSRGFDVTITYDKTSQQLDLAPTITPELLPQNDRDRSGGGHGYST